MRKALIVILAVCLTLASCAREAAPLQVSYITASPAPFVRAYVPSPTSEASTSQTDAQPTNTTSPELSPPSDEGADETSPSAPPLSDAQILFKFAKDIDGDGSNENIYVASGNNDPLEGNGGDIFIYVQDGSLSNGYYIDSAESCDAAYYTKTEKGVSCLIVSLEYEDAYTSAFVYSLADSSAVLKDEIDGSVSKVDGTKIEAVGYVDILGTWDYHCSYKLNNDFKLSQKTEYLIDCSEKGPLHTIKELPVQMLVGGVYVNQTLGKGTNIYPTSTDGSTYLNFKLKDGSKGKILVKELDSDLQYSDSYDGMFLIDGISENEYFDNIDYAG